MEKMKMLEKVGNIIVKPYVGVNTPNYNTVRRFLEIAASAGCVLEINYDFKDETWCYVIDTTKDESITTFVWYGDINDLIEKIAYPTIPWRDSDWA